MPEVSTMPEVQVGKRERLVRKDVTKLLEMLWWIAVCTGTCLFGISWAVADTFGTDWFELIQTSISTPILLPVFLISLIGMALTWHYGQRNIAKAKLQDQKDQAAASAEFINRGDINKYLDKPIQARKTKRSATPRKNPTITITITC